MIDLKSAKFSWSVGIFILALALRCLYWFFLRREYFFYDHPAGDVLYYQDWANQIARGDWLGKEAFWGMPLYPYFLAVLKRLFLGSEILLRFFHLFLGSINCILAYQLAKRIFSRKAAILAGILMAANFVLIHYDWLMTPVTLIIALTLIILLAVLQLKPDSPKKEWFYTGLLLGLTVAGDGKFLIFFALLLTYWILRYRRETQKKIFYSLGVFILGTALIVFGVMLRNKIVSGDWILISSQSGLSFFVGNNPEATGRFENPEFITPTHEGQDRDQQVYARQATGRKDLTPKEVRQFWSQKAWDFIQNSPRHYLNLLRNKFILFFTEDENTYDLDLLLQLNWKHRADFNPLHLIVPPALLGIIVTARRRETWPAILILLSQLMFTLIFFLTDHHRATILPLLLVYQSGGLFWLLEQGRQRHFLNAGIALAFLIFVSILFRPIVFDSHALEFLRASKAGVVWEKRGELEKAREEYLKALRLRPHDTTTFFNLTNIYLLTEEFEPAIQNYRAILAAMPSHIDSRYNLGYAYEQTGRFEDAVAEYQRVIQLDPTALDAHLRLAGIYDRLEKCEETQRHIQAILKHNPAVKKGLSTVLNNCPLP